MRKHTRKYLLLFVLLPSVSALTDHLQGGHLQRNACKWLTLRWPIEAETCRKIIQNSQ